MKESTVSSSNPIAPSELIITEEGRIYHINLKDSDIADDVIVVGDQERVKQVSKHFSTIEVKISKREFITHTGFYKGHRITVLSTGIGTDNIDIAINELDAAVNIDFTTRKPKEQKRKLNIIRIGTSGSLQEDIPVDSFVVSSYGLGFDGLLGFYKTYFEDDELALKKAFVEQIKWPNQANTPYFTKGNSKLINKIGQEMHKGITATANGFYGPQGRSLRLATAVPNLNEQLNSFSFNKHRITNFEMETSALYGLSSLLGHNACTTCAIIANRFKKEYSKDYKKTVDQLIEVVLERIIA
ncbi:MAG: phosphorylase [Crocinitomicaceae bacterium]|nr:phosphorylase [Crocinitomicaceae bacterium]|tara:strand:- start:5326 stop:6222 length:897 start_codon:yes stop_codon:yes gene_type:complete